MPSTSGRSDALTPPAAPGRRAWAWRWERFCAGRPVCLVVSALLLAPCFWQPRIQAGDLSNHIYNSWMAQFIESGRAQGLIVTRQTTNVLFDLILGGLFRICGAEAAQRIAVSLAVLIFAWGAFAFVSTVAGRRAWNLMPCIAMLAYGWVFHMGFFNFYLALGLCFWAMSAAWHPRPARLAAAVGLLALGYLAHAVPVVWCLCLLAYMALARNRSPRGRAYLTLGALALMAVARVWTTLAFQTRWSPSQIARITGADQVWVFDAKYCLALAGLLIVWGLLFLNLIHAWGTSRVIASVPFQLFIMSAGGVMILPATVFIPGFLHALAFIAERMSLGVGVCVCALLAAARPRPFERYAMLGVTMIFFAFLYRDERALNALEDRLGGAVAQIATGQYMVSPADEPLYAVDLDESGRVVVRTLKAGTLCGSTFWKILPDLIPAS